MSTQNDIERIARVGQSAGVVDGLVAAQHRMDVYRQRFVQKTESSRIPWARRVAGEEATWALVFSARDTLDVLDLWRADLDLSLGHYRKQLSSALKEEAAARRRLLHPGQLLARRVIAAARAARQAWRVTA